VRRLLLLVALLSFAAPANAEWWEAKTDHFIVDSESSAKDTRDFAEKLERYDEALRGLQGIGEDEKLSDSGRVTVFRWGHTGEIAALYGNTESGVAGFYIARASGPVAFVPAREYIGRKSLIDAQTVLFHEYAHHFMFRHFAAAYPTWYVEAFAEVNSTIQLNDDGSFKLGAPPQARAEALSGGLQYSIKELLLSSNEPDFNDVLARYTYGWLLTHYLTFNKSRAGQLTKYLKLINHGVAPSDAAPQAFGDLDQLERDVMQYKAKNNYPGAIARPAHAQTPAVATRKLGPDEEAIMWVRIRSARGVNQRQAGDVAGDARSVAAKFPSSIPVLLALTEAEFDHQQFDAAGVAADRALALDPSSVKAMLYKGRVYLERAKKDRQQFATARTWFAKANRTDPLDASALFEYYRTYVQEGVAPPPIAVAGLERAYEIAPFDFKIRMVLARELLVEKKGPLARQVLLPLALAPHESDRAKALNEVAQLIESGNPDAALKKLDERMAKEEEKKTQH
jgi:tetratricopeptide (TPR) repeat protein